MGGGFSGGGNLQNMVRQARDSAGGGMEGGMLSDSTAQPRPAGGPGGPGEPAPSMYNYGGMGRYNTLTQDMSRNVMGNSNFNNNQFGYSPFGNPFGGQSPWQPQQPWGGAQGGYGGQGPFGYGQGMQGGYGGSGYGYSGGVNRGMGKVMPPGGGWGPPGPQQQMPIPGRAPPPGQQPMGGQQPGGPLAGLFPQGWTMPASSPFGGAAHYGQPLTAMDRFMGSLGAPLGRPGGMGAPPGASQPAGAPVLQGMGQPGMSQYTRGWF